MRDQRTKLALKLACLFVFPLELQLVSQSLLRTMELNHFWMNVLIFLLLCLSEIFGNPQNSQKTKIQNKKICCENSMLFNIKSLGSIDWLPVPSDLDTQTTSLYYSCTCVSRCVSVSAHILHLLHKTKTKKSTTTKRT